MNQNSSNRILSEGFAALNRKAAAEGIVLLKNENHVLPFQKGEKIAVFGRCQIDYYRSGTGSGGAVNVPYKVNILDGMRDQKIFTADEELAKIYKEWLKTHPFDNGGGGWAAEPWHQQEMELSEDLLASASSKNQKAVVVIGRTAGEDQDNGDTEGSYRLTKAELSMLKGVCRHFQSVVVLLNVPNIIDMKWMQEPEIAASLKAILYIWQGGMEGGHAVADVLSGTVTPSGKLVDTIAFDISDYPSTKNYGDEVRNFYAEDIYVGYRYFETFAPEKVLYPFGYGLSYTDFSMEEKDCVYDEENKTIRIEAAVKNIGAFEGKETVQIYVEAPQGLLGKPSRVLAGFAKTAALKPGDEEILTIDVPLHRFASYDDGGVTGRKSCWVLEAGEYRFYMGNSCRAEKLVSFPEGKSFSLEALLVLEELEEALSPQLDFQRIVPGEKRTDGRFEVAYEAVPTKTFRLAERILGNLPEEIPYTGNQNIKLRDVYEKKATLDAFIAQLSPEDLSVIVRGEGMSSPKVTEGTASAFGGVGDNLLDLGIPVACAADGPSGIRMEGGRMATQLPIGTLLASTWDVKLLEELYEWEGKEMVLNQIDTLLGPGMNIRRNPLNGRNFEYFSEDPLMTGAMAAAIVRGIHKGGAHATMKHFACNNQEKTRVMTDSVLSERALREIYLKGFEITVKEADAQSVMSSYNPINGYWAASNYDLLTTILRKDWGFTGIVMTDWWAKMNHAIRGGEATTKQTGSMVRCQNDLYMVVSNNGAEVNASGDDTLEALTQGELTLGELQRNAKNICGFLMKTPVFLEGRETASMEREISPATANEEAELLSDRIRIPLPGGFSVKEEGIFDVYVNCMCPGPNQMQTACNILMNDQEVSILQTNGTNGRWILQKLVRVHLKPGYYHTKLSILKPGIQIEWLELARKS